MRCALSFLVRHLVGKSSATLGVCHCHRGRAWGFGASRLGGVAAHAPKHRFTLEPLLRRQRLGRRAPGNKSRQRQRAEKSCGFGHLFVPVKDNLRLTLKGLGPLRLDSNQPCHAQPCQGFVLAPGRVSRARCSLRAPYDQIGNLGSDGLPACERRAITSRTTGRFAFPRAPGPDALRRRRKWTIRIALVAALEQFAAGTGAHAAARRRSHRLEAACGLFSHQKTGVLKMAVVTAADDTTNPREAAWLKHSH